MDALSPDELVTAYLQALSSADVDAAVRLFAAGGVVHSPLYGTRPAREFYLALFADTSRSVLTLRRTLVSADAASVAFWFDFDWTLADGTPAPFTVVDVAELDEAGSIRDLHIVYDTHPLRDSWERQDRG